MRIAIDARMIKPGSMHGIARYVYHLLMQLRSMKERHTFLVLVHQTSPLLKQEWPEHMSLVPTRSEWISFAEQIELPKVLKQIQADLFHAPSYVAPLMTPCKLMMTIHDLNHLVLPQFYTPFHQLYYRLIVESCIRKSKAILTVSQFSKTEIVKNLRLDAAKIKVTYNGVSELYRPVTDLEFLEYVRDLYELPERFIFCLSNNKPHKNIQQLVRAYCMTSIDLPLVLASQVDRNVIRIAENSGKKHLIYFTKFIAEEHLPAVYSMTDLFVYPSAYEGFGLPPLEALSCGAPVIVANTTSLPEVVGQHAIFNNPYDIQSIAQSLEEGVNNRMLRDQLSREGQKHARQFTWQRMAEQTVEAYEQGLGAS